ncbi:hypothetical protein SISNIDRAFT_490524 [Sistotremastrum niveocremeum HHB9708]|uniref:DUF7918 domain-containing protein n=1 Tax=Sistotremastrum niveocremeum HHB9708 TaxID=1314777 RepID=A0A164NSX3_9AGAM|nr:hypothetical protein SISNIDRAFT_490524 [Sistotremastrum niveocremeum HHB9708]
MPNVDGFGAYIKIEDNRLDEYKIESSSFRDNGHEDNVRVACHIASEAGKHFHIGIRLPKAPSVQLFRITVDIDGTPVRTLNFAPTRTRNEVFRTYRLDSLHRTPLLFGKLKLTDDENMAETNEERITALGTILIRIFPVYLTDIERVRKYESLQPLLPVLETKKKGASHCLQRGDLIARPVQRSTRIVKKRIRGHRSYEFLFHYAAHAWLQVEGIIPTGARTSAKGRSTLTSDVAVDITPRSVSPGDEDAELLLDPEEAQQLRKLNEKMADRRRHRAVKREPLVPLMQGVPPATVIDLTGDDD